jgi:sugar lactone lactonase YvrE
MNSLINCSIRLFCALLVTGSQIVYASGIITTVAGGAHPPENIPAISADIQAQSVDVDSEGDLYISGEYRVFKIDVDGIISTVAGTGRIPGRGTSGYNGDGIPAIDADLSNPSAVAVDSGGNLYIADRDNGRIRKVDSAGIISTVAGGGSLLFDDEGGPAINGHLGHPTDIAFSESGDLYIADSDYHRIRKIDANGIITTVVGNCTSAGCSGSFSGDGGLASASGLNHPSGFVFDAEGNLYIADTGNNRIRKVDGNGIITTVAGNGQAGYDGDGSAAISAELNSPSGVAVDAAGNLYINDGVAGNKNFPDSGNHRVRKVDASGIITTIAGNGSAGFSGDGGAAINAQLNYPSGLALDGGGNLFIADRGNNRIRMIGTDAKIATVAGNGWHGIVGDGNTANLAMLNSPRGLAIDAAGNLYLSDTLDDRIRKVDANGIITTVAGIGDDPTVSGSGDGEAATGVQINSPEGIAVDASGNLYIADGTIRKVDESGIITTVAGNSTMGPGYSGDGGPATSAQLSDPQGVAVDPNGNIYISDTGNDTIRKVDTSGIITTVVGNGTPYVGVLNHPLGITADAGGDLYIADTYNNVVRRLSPTGILTTVAGNGSASFSGDGGLATMAGLDAPSAVAVDSAGNLYILDAYNQRVRKVENNFISTIAGNGMWNSTYEYGTFSGDGGPATSAGLSFPLAQFSLGLAVDVVGNVYIADNGNNRVRRVGLSLYASAGRNQSVMAETSGTIDISLDGSGSYDADGDPLTYSWTGPFGTATGMAPMVTLDVGSWDVNLTVDDGHGDSATDTVSIIVTASDSPAADLVVSDLSSTTTALFPGQTLSAVTTVMNQGNMDAGFFRVAFSLSADPVYGNGDDIPLSTVLLVGSLSVDGSYTASTTLIVPSTTPVGNYYLCAMTDSTLDINEGYHEDNNTLCTSSAIAVTYPDLVMTDVTPAAATVNQGATLDVGNTVKNQGLMPSAFSSVQFRLSLNTVFGDADDVVVSAIRNVPTLDSGEYDTRTTRITVPASTPPNKYYLCAKVDSGSTVLETVEDNNDLCSPTRVTVPKPDLVVSAVSTNMTSRRAGAQINIYNAIVNQGGSNAGSSIVAFHLSSNSSYGDGDDIVSPTTRTIGSMAIGARSAGPTFVKIPATTPAGVYYMCVRADDADSVDESDEANNVVCTATTFTVN